MSKDPAAVALGRKGGLARNKNLTPEQIKEIATKAGKAGAAARWGKRPARKKRAKS